MMIEIKFPKSPNPPTALKRTPSHQYSKLFLKSIKIISYLSIKKARLFCRVENNNLHFSFGIAFVSKNFRTFYQINVSSSEIDPHSELFISDDEVSLTRAI
jgi:hypothetical protein